MGNRAITHFNSQRLPLPTGKPLTIAGLWDEWKEIETGQPLVSRPMIITIRSCIVGKVISVGLERLADRACARK
jgi:hypothetical protein